jgi:hypothetical protein
VSQVVGFRYAHVCIVIMRREKEESAPTLTFCNAIFLLTSLRKNNIFKNAIAMY